MLKWQRLAHIQKEVWNTIIKTNHKHNLKNWPANLILNTYTFQMECKVQLYEKISDGCGNNSVLKGKIKQSKFSTADSHVELWYLYLSTGMINN